MGVMWGLDLYHTIAISSWFLARSYRLFEVSELLYKKNIDSYTPIASEVKVKKAEIAQD